METNELKKIWNTLAETKLVNKEVAMENIKQIITQKGNGVISKLSRRFHKDILVDIINTLLVGGIIVFVFIFQSRFGIEKRAHIFLFLIEAFFIVKLLRDHTKYKLLNMSKLNNSIKESTIDAHRKIKRRIIQDGLFSGIFLMLCNIYAIGIYFRAFGNVKSIDFSHFNSQMIGFIILIFLLLFIVIFPIVMKSFYKKKYVALMDEIEATIKELNEDI
ncbi:MAG: hypothetical protein JXB49_02070 [Bacteroidales bacterium]|nr:hypothetical protein [Bacteroidales bacterium]